ncbi:MAG: hypothetical protein KAR35_10400, partial [Candidatus Heimdallarchaeota archaeon]|nr:hypothetical protein [Candidatus Heimdallarchaeota archaeon]MCK5049767.1 hypothetical protein [Candidatus Heimdallarchaeota archaeon]
QLSGEEIQQRIYGKTVRGEHHNGRKYVGYTDQNGNMEGINDRGSHHFGKSSINMEDKTFTVKWDKGWENWTSRAYDVDGEIKFFDSTTSKWRTTFKQFEDGKKAIIY